ncbi:hypothetical protein BD779DRAFT_1789843 [Infundibulicybe gibba]|nr:hypothetical protein BD779DRAFT_1789843 [Infundibulicybe gibba]
MAGNGWKRLVTFFILVPSGHQSQPCNDGIVWQDLVLNDDPPLPLTVPQVGCASISLEILGESFGIILEKINYKIIEALRVEIVMNVGPLGSISKGEIQLEAASTSDDDGGSAYAIASQRGVTFLFIRSVVATFVRVAGCFDFFLGGAGVVGAK